MNSLKTEVIDAMVAAGMTSALLAPEHGSEYIRNTVIKKGLKRDTIYQVVEDLKKHRVSLAGNWIMGFPEDTNETLQETMDMIDELQLDRNWVGTLIPFPGTPVFDQCVRDKLFIEGIDMGNLWRVPCGPTRKAVSSSPTICHWKTCLPGGANSLISASNTCAHFDAHALPIKAHHHKADKKSPENSGLFHVTA
jgi:hypothetical protein